MRKSGKPVDRDLAEANGRQGGKLIKSGSALTGKCLEGLKEEETG